MSSAKVLTFKAAIEALRKHPLFDGLTLKLPTTAGQTATDSTAFQVTYDLGEPIIIGDPSFGPVSGNASNVTPGIRVPTFDHDKQRHTELWNTTTRLNPLFVIKDGLVEVHHPCHDDQESVPRAQLSRQDYFGEYELHPGNPRPYRFSATAGFRTVVCWRISNKKTVRISKLKTFLSGHDVNLYGHDAWAYHILRDFAAEAQTNVQTTVYILPQVPLLRLMESNPALWQRLWAQHVIRAETTTALSEHIDISSANIATLGLQPTQTSPYDAQNKRRAYVLRAVRWCLEGKLPYLVPIAYYDGFRKWDMYFNARLLYGDAWRTQIARRGANYSGCCLFFVPAIGQATIESLYTPKQPLEIETYSEGSPNGLLHLATWDRCITQAMLSSYTNLQLNNLNTSRVAEYYKETFSTLEHGRGNLPIIKVNPLVAYTPRKAVAYLKQNYENAATGFLEDSQFESLAIALLDYSDAVFYDWLNASAMDPAHSRDDVFFIRRPSEAAPPQLIEGGTMEPLSAKTGAP